MIKYDIGILSLIHEIRAEYPQVMHPWYVGDSDTEDTFVAL